MAVPRKPVVKKNNWVKTTNRFIAFFDILGFKELVRTTKHEEILKKLEDLVTIAQVLSTEVHKEDVVQKLGIQQFQVKSATFSDSIVLFSKSDKIEDAIKIVIDCNFILRKAIEFGLPIKGAISFGKMTVDFNKALFFGQPLIDAYLLHEELHMLACICDHKFENRIATFGEHVVFTKALTKYKAKMKYGKVHHMLLKPVNKDVIENVEKLYASVSGSPRQYIENTLEYLKEI